MRVKAETILSTMRSWIGMNRANGTHQPILDIYNNHRPLARNYKVKTNDSYCDATISAAFIKNSAEDMLGGTECGVEEHVKKFIKKGIWNEDGTITPKPGYIIVYNWDEKKQPNNGYSDHIAVVEKVAGNTITTIEGNIGGVVGRRTIAVGDGVIRGYAIPDYLPANEASHADWTGETGKGWRYSEDGKNFVRNKWLAIKHHWYYFGEDGYAYTGLHYISGKLYYFATTKESVDYECALMKTDKDGAFEIWKL